MSMEDPNMPVEGDLEDTPTPAGSNRNFLLLMAGLGGLTLLMIILIAGFAFIVAPGRENSRATEVAAREATNAAVQATNDTIVQNATEEAIVRQATSDAAATQAILPTSTETPLPTAVPTETPIPTETPLPPPSDTPAPGTPEGGQGGSGTATNTPVAGTPDSGQAAGTATVTPTRAGGTVTSTPLVGALTRVPSPTALPNTGFADDVGIPMLIIIALALVAVVVVARRLRMTLR